MVVEVQYVVAVVVMVVVQYVVVVEVVRDPFCRTARVIGRGRLARAYNFCLRALSILMLWKRRRWWTLLRARETIFIYDDVVDNDV